MMYYELETGNKVYKLRLNTRNIIELEKKIGGNPLSIFGTGERIPTVTEMITILHCSLQQYEHGITLNEAYEIFDSWISEGNAAVEFLNIIVEVYKVSGIINNNQKN